MSFGPVVHLRPEDSSRFTDTLRDQRSEIPYCPGVSFERVTETGRLAEGASYERHFALSRLAGDAAGRF